jgi:hypothetical protein
MAQATHFHLVPSYGMCGANLPHPIRLHIVELNYVQAKCYQPFSRVLGIVM